MSRIISVKAKNLKKGDVLDGCRIRLVHRFTRRCRKASPEPGDMVGVLVVYPHPDGYTVNTETFVGSERVSIKRPKNTSL